MQITIEIPDELSNLIQNKGKSLNTVIIEALGLYVQYGSPTNTIPNPIQPEINWAAKWEQWFAECETIDVIFPNAKS